MVDHHGRFVWYELLTTDIAAAKAFYSSVVGWGAQNASTPDLAYTLFTAGEVPMSGLMELPQDALNRGAMPRWVGYVAVDDADAIAERITRLGGAIYVPPTDSNIGRIAVVTDPQTATFALVEGLRHGQAAMLPKPPWFITNKRAQGIGQRLVEFEAAPNPLRLAPIFSQALRG